MTHIGTAAMFLSGIMLQAQSGSFNFNNIEQAINTLSTANPAVLHIILALFFYGFATKAGVYPFGTWLPDAHPAAPSGISAMLSGIMIKMGIYGILRVFLFMIPVSNSILIPWGIVISTFRIVPVSNNISKSASTKFQSHPPLLQF
jgi:hydrogenase-4 component B